MDAGDVGDVAGREAVEIFAVGRVGDHFGVAAVAREMRKVGRLIVMDRPQVAIDMIPAATAGREFIAREPEDLAARRLEIIPDPLSVGREEFMPGDFHVHEAFVDQLLARAVGADGQMRSTLCQGLSLIHI